MEGHVMAEQNELHFETIDKNKDINLQRNKLKYLEDRIATLEKAVERLNKMIGEQNAK
jgi:uncharacterized coiled-coil protein SlyX